MCMSSNDKLIALVEINGQWRTATPLGAAHEHITQALSPATLPPNVRPLMEPAPARPVTPLVPWLAEFAPGSGEPRPTPRPIADTANTQTPPSLHDPAPPTTRTAPEPLKFTPNRAPDSGSPTPSPFDSTRCRNCGANRVNAQFCDDCGSLLCESCEHPCQCNQQVQTPQSTPRRACAECGKQRSGDRTCGDCRMPLCEECQCMCWMDKDLHCTKCARKIDEANVIYGGAAPNRDLVCDACSNETEDSSICWYCGQNRSNDGACGCF